MVSGQAGRARIPALDMARGMALIGMATFHFTYDLEMFGHVAPGLTATPGWALFARLVAGSFLFLAGVSLWLGHGRGIRWRPFARRLAQIVAAAGLVTVATYLAEPDAFVFFGILHSIATASVIGLIFLRVPAGLTLAVAAAVVAARFYLRTGLFDAPWLAWLGLTSYGIRSVDFVPVFPWLAVFLVGLAAARWADGRGLWPRLPAPGGRAAQALAWAGRHSLAVYLIHQPVLLALVWLATAVLH